MSTATALAPSPLSWLGIARELNAGAPLLPTATIPTRGGTYQPEDTPVFLSDQAVRAVMAGLFGKVIGPEDATFSYGGPWFFGPGGYWLDSLCGDLSTVSNGTLGTARALAAATAAGATSLTVGSTLGSVITGSIIQIGDGAASEIVVATTGSTGTTVNFTGTPCRFAHTTTATAALQTAAVTYTHVFGLLNSGTGQPPTHTLTDFTGLTPTVGGRAYPSACVSQLEITGNPTDLLTYRVTGNSWLSTPAAAAPTVQGPFTVPAAGWHSTVTVAGVPINTTGEWTVTFKRELLAYWSPQSGLTPFVLARGDLDIAGTLDYTVPSDETPLTNMLAGAALPVVISSSNGVAGAGQLTMTITMSQAQFTQARPGRTTPVIGYADGWEAVTNTTDVGGSGGMGPGTVALTNAQPTY